MSEPKKSGLGLFINTKKTTAKPASAPAAAAPAGKKNVQKRWIYVGLGLVAVVVLTNTLATKDAAPVDTSAAVKKSSIPTINTTPPNADKDAFTARYGQDLAAVTQRLAVLEKEKAAQEAKKLEDSKAGKTEELPAGLVPPPVKGGNSGGIGSLGAVPPAPPLPPVRTPSGVNGGTSVVPQISVGAGGSPGGTELPPSMPYAADAPLVFDAPASAKPADAPTSAATMNGVDSTTKYKKNTTAGLLPAGSFAPVALLNGVDAGTGTSTASNPMPVLMRINDHATLPGSARYRLKSCFVLASAYGDMSAERVYARISRLSCVDKNDRLVVSQTVSGYLVDSDGKLGLRGMVTDRQGAKIGKAMLAGFAQGLSGALGQAQSSVTSGALGTSTSTIGGDAALRAAGLNGAQTAASQLAQFYLKEASAMFPIITVDAGRTGTIVFTESTKLDWSDTDSQFTQQVTPK